MDYFALTWVTWSRRTRCAELLPFFFPRAAFFFPRAAPFLLPPASFSVLPTNPRSGMARSSQSGAGSSSQSGAALVARRDADGFLPLVQCTKCGTRLVGRVSQKSGSLGKRFYKCPRLEHTPMACKFYMFEEQYIEFLAKYGAEAGTNGSQHCNKTLQDSIDVIEQCNVELQRACAVMKEAESALKAASDSKIAMGAKLERIGDRLVLVGLANIFLVVLVLMVLLVK